MKLNLKAHIGDLKYIVLATIIQVFVDTCSSNIRIALFELVVENSVEVNHISENMRRVLIFTILN
jgi:hypothetical protein